MIGFALFFGLVMGICIEWLIQEYCTTDMINLYTGVWVFVLILLCMVAIFGYYEGWFLTEEVAEVLVH